MLLKSRTSLTCFRACFLPGRAKDLSAPRYEKNLLRPVFIQVSIQAVLLPDSCYHTNVPTFDIHSSAGKRTVGTCGVAVRHDRWQYDMIGGSMTWSVVVRHDRWQYDMIGGSMTWSVAVRHDRWQYDMIGGSTTWSVAAQHDYKKYSDYCGSDDTAKWATGHSWPQNSHHYFAPMGQCPLWVKASSLETS